MHLEAEVESHQRLLVLRELHLADSFVQAQRGVEDEIEWIKLNTRVKSFDCFSKVLRLEDRASLFLFGGAELECFDGAHCISEIRVVPNRILKNALALNFLAGVAENTTSPALNERHVHHIRVGHQLFRVVDCFLHLI